MEIRIIDAMHEKDINRSNQPFSLRGRMVISYTGTRWEHREEVLRVRQAGRDALYKSRGLGFHLLQSSKT